MDMLLVPGRSQADAEMAQATRWAGTGAGRLAESALRIGGIHCAACVPAIEQAVQAVEGVASVHVDAAAQRAIVRWEPARTSPSSIVEAIARAGYSAVPDVAQAARRRREADLKIALWRLFVAAFCSMQVMMFAAPGYFGESGGLTPDLARLLMWASWLATLPVMCFSASVFFKGAWRSLVTHRRIGMDVPVALGIAVAFAASTAATFDPGSAAGTGVYFDSLTMFVTFLLGGRYLELRARHRAERLLEDSAVAMPQTAWRVEPDGRTSEVALSALRTGDVLRVVAGGVVPADGPLCEGRTRVDESMLSGESRPVNKVPGDALVAGSVNLDGPVDMKVHALGADTRHERILALAREAQSHRATTALRQGDRWAGPFLWTVLMLAALAAWVWHQVDPARAIEVAVAVLIVTCPCALSLAAPSALLSAAGAMSRRGVLLRRLDAIDGLARMQRLFVDKTGTLTQPLEAAARIHVMPNLPEGMDPAGLRAIAGALAARSDHPLSRALAVPDAPPPPGWHDFMELRGRGVQAVDPQGAVWRLGSAAWVAPDAPDAAGLELPVWLGREGRRVAGFELDEQMRPDAPDCVAALRGDGVQVSLVSGDLPQRVQRVAEQAGVADFRGGLQPEDKLHAVREAQGRGEVTAMLGDGINDLPVLAQADLSIAMGEGAWAARAEADAVLVSNGLADLVSARDLARRTLRVMNQNLAWAAAYNLTCVPLALIGWLPPWAAGLGMAASSLGVVLNSMRLTRVATEAP